MTLEVFYFSFLSHPSLLFFTFVLNFFTPFNYDPAKPGHLSLSSAPVIPCIPSRKGEPGVSPACLLSGGDIREMLNQAQPRQSWEPGGEDQLSSHHSTALKAQGRPQENEKGKYHTQQLHKEVKRKAQTAGEELI